MSSMRVTQSLMVSRVLSDLNTQTKGLLDLQTELSTGLKVNSPSDDPLAARRAVNIRATMAADEQYITNISAISSQLTESTTSIQTVIDALTRAQELATQGATGTTSQTQMTQLAAEVDELLESVLAEANHQTNGRYVFGGTSTLSAPFVATRDADGNITAITYEGNSESSQIAIGNGVNVTINESGDDVFQSTQDVFQMLIDIRDNLNDGDQTSLQNDRLAELSDAQDQLLISMAKLGAVQNRVETVSSDTENAVAELESTLSDNIDADYAETVVHLNAQSNAYQAALSAAAKVIQPTLLDFVQ